MGIYSLGPSPFLVLHLCWAQCWSSFTASSLKPFLTEPSVRRELSLLPWVCRTLDRSLVVFLCSCGLQLIVNKSLLPP